MNEVQQMVRDMMAAFGQATPDGPTLDSYPFELRSNLIEEEFNEFAEACGYTRDLAHGGWRKMKGPDFVKMVDALGDLLVVTYGAAVACGVDMEPVMAEIQRSNLSKLAEDGSVIRRADGKVMKGPNYSPPDIASVLERQRTKVATVNGTSSRTEAARFAFWRALDEVPRHEARRQIKQLLVELMDSFQQSYDEEPVIAAYDAFVTTEKQLLTAKDLDNAQDA